MYFECGSKNNSETLKDFRYENKVPVQLFQINDLNVKLHAKYTMSDDFDLYDFHRIKCRYLIFFWQKDAQISSQIILRALHNVMKIMIL